MTMDYENERSGYEGTFGNLSTLLARPPPLCPSGTIPIVSASRVEKSVKLTRLSRFS